jgi:hypothetical protein
MRRLFVITAEFHRDVIIQNSNAFLQNNSFL